MKYWLSLILPLIVLLGRADALINFGLDNSANASDPGVAGVAWDATARMANYDEGAGTVSNPAGTAVHLGNGYMLTADHVIVRSHVSFDGSTWLAVDNGFTPQQVAADVDLKVFKLASTPNTAAVTLHGGGDETGVLGYNVGWGRGRGDDLQIGDNIQDFGKDGTIDKRWGTNVIKATGEVTWDGLSGGTDFTQEALVSVLGNDEGVNESALALWDSGSPFFQEINGTMVLTGIAGSRSLQNGGPGDFKATFGNDTLGGNPNARGDRNFYVQIGAYKDEIESIVPESKNYGLLLGMLSVGAVLALTRGRSRGPSKSSV
ncbi:MAG: hypothetical protein GVY36_02370 [Verrucomicrobia bacterium]|jgi:hypothetical protein|nr:hypothetical protein [Verrucomicrobiota bacterium]